MTKKELDEIARRELAKFLFKELGMLLVIAPVWLLIITYVPGKIILGAIFGVVLTLFVGSGIVAYGGGKKEKNSDD